MSSKSNIFPNKNPKKMPVKLDIVGNFFKHTHTHTHTHTHNHPLM